MSLRVRCQGCLGGRPSGSVLGDAPVASVEPGHVHRGALSGPPVRTYPGRPQHNNGSFGSLQRRPAGSRGGNPLRDMGSALTVDPWGDRRRGVSRAQGPSEPPPATGQAPAWSRGPARHIRAPMAPWWPYRRPVIHSRQPRPAPPPGEAPRTPNRPGHRALCEARYAGRRQSAEEAGHDRVVRKPGSAVTRWCGGAGRTRTGRTRTRNGYGTRLSGPRPGRSRGGPHPCRSGAGGRCANPAP